MGFSGLYAPGVPTQPEINPIESRTDAPMSVFCLPAEPTQAPIRLTDADGRAINAWALPDNPIADGEPRGWRRPRDLWAAMGDAGIGAAGSPTRPVLIGWTGSMAGPGELAEGDRLHGAAEQGIGAGLFEAHPLTAGPRGRAALITAIRRTITDLSAAAPSTDRRPRLLLRPHARHVVGDPHGLRSLLADPALAEFVAEGLLGAMPEPSAMLTPEMLPLAAEYVERFAEHLRTLAMLDAELGLVVTGVAAASDGSSRGKRVTEDSAPPPRRCSIDDPASALPAEWFARTLHATLGPLRAAVLLPDAGAMSGSRTAAQAAILAAAGRGAAR